MWYVLGRFGRYPVFSASTEQVLQARRSGKSIAFINRDIYGA
jgi:hypothetical protein